MPKLGRRDGTRGPVHESQLSYLFPQEAQERRTLEPFGTENTPAMRVKLVGGVPQMVVEDYKYREAKEVPPTPVRLAPKVHTTRQFNPDKINTYPMTLYGYKDSNNPSETSSHQGRSEYSQELNPEARRPRESFSPHRVLPPIGGRSHHSNFEQTSFESDPTSMLEQKLPLTTYLPKQPVIFRKQEMLELKRRVCDEMRDFDLCKLKDVYMTLTGFDRHLLGHVSFEELNETLRKFRTDIAVNTLRLVASQYINDDQPPKINYEKVLSFISGALKEANSVDPVTHNPPRPVGGGGGQYLDGNVNVSCPQDGIYYNPLTHKVGNYSTNSQKYPGGQKGNAKLLSLLEQQLLDVENDFDIQLAWRTFTQADRQRRNMLSREQIKAMSNACKIPLQDNIMNQIIDRCDGSNGQYNWQQYLEFIERVAPAKTGLQIPESKKPREYAVQMPQPSKNWPNADTDDKSYGGPVPNGLRDSSQYFEPGSYNSYYDGPRSPAAPPKSESRQSHVHALENKIRDLEMQYNRDRELLLGKKNEAISEEPWFDRYYRLANALYAQDGSNNGFVKKSEARWLINQYNRDYHLGISEANVERTLDQCSDGDNVVLSALLKSLMMYEV